MSRDDVAPAASLAQALEAMESEHLTRLVQRLDRGDDNAHADFVRLLQAHGAPLVEPIADTRDEVLVRFVYRDAQARQVRVVKGPEASRRPVLRWELAGGADGAIVDLSKDRPCSPLFASMSVAGTTATPPSLTVSITDFPCPRGTVVALILVAFVGFQRNRGAGWTADRQRLDDLRWCLA